jgi:HD-GYP domain-containing protein (c-di-GMP phosphodiesterase class II)
MASPAASALDQSTQEAASASAIAMRLAERTGLPFLIFDRNAGGKVDFREPSLPPYLPEPAQQWLLELEEADVFDVGEGVSFYGMPLWTSAGRWVAFGFQLKPGATPTSDLRDAARNAGWSSGQLIQWTSTHPRCSTEPLLALLRHADEGALSEAQSQISQLSEQLDQTYEEIALLHRLTRNLQVSRSPADLVDLCLERLPELIDAESHVIQLHSPGEPARMWAIGKTLRDREDVEDLVRRLTTQESSRPIVRNFLKGSPLELRFPKLRNFVAVPVREGQHRFGWIISANLSQEREFGTVEASCLNTIATILGTHVRNIELLHEQNDLLLGFVRSFVSTLDAKDPYTRGHSERVALIARRIGQQMGLPQEELRTIYLSGLLHDVGKIGVDDQILRKNGPLTGDEFEQVKKHPVIGYNILSSLKNLRHVLPGVRNHHESFDGSGYPDGLAGEEIPLLARILAVADAFDAMGSDRPYRKGMPATKIEQIFSRGSNVQWDGAVLSGYFDCREDVFAICADYSLDRGVLHESPTSCGLQSVRRAEQSGGDVPSETERQLQAQTVRLSHHACE